MCAAMHDSLCVNFVHERGYSVFDTHLFAMYCIKYWLNYYNLNLCLGTLLAECIQGSFADDYKMQIKKWT